MISHHKTQEKYQHIIRSPVLRWALLFISWTVFGLFMAAEWIFRAGSGGNPVAWSAALFSEMVYAYIWLFLTPIVLWLTWRFPFQVSRRLAHASLHLGFSVIIAFVHRMTFTIITLLSGATTNAPFSWNEVFGSLLRYFDYGIMLYWILFLFRQSIEYYRRYQEQELQKSQLEAQLNLAQLRALKMQLQPHFLFNTLNGISVLVRKNPDAACTMIARLADLLRMTLDNTGAQEIPLHQELKTLGCYLEIEQMRFSDRLKVSLEIPEETRNAYVPNLILQPLVENAIRHGVSKQLGPATISIRSRRENGSLELRVEDNGPGIPRSGVVREGIGFSNTRSRLQKLYGEEYSFDMRNGAESGAVATVRIPFHTKEETAQ